MRSAGYDVVGVSTDDQETSDRFRESLDLPYPLVGDADQKIVRAYRAKWPLVGLAQRVTYIVNRDKTVKLAHHREFNVPSHINAACTQPGVDTASYHSGASFGDE